MGTVELHLPALIPNPGGASTTIPARWRPLEQRSERSRVSGDLACAIVWKPYANQHSALSDPVSGRTNPQSVSSSSHGYGDSESLHHSVADESSDVDAAPLIDFSTQCSAGVSSQPLHFEPFADSFGDIHTQDAPWEASFNELQSTAGQVACPDSISDNHVKLMATNAPPDLSGCEGCTSVRSTVEPHGAVSPSMGTAVDLDALTELNALFSNPPVPGARPSGPHGQFSPGDADLSLRKLQHAAAPPFAGTFWDDHS